jgi:uncharacterized membrane protein (UPF0127 family)
MMWRVRDVVTGRVLAARVRRADGWLERTLGFLPRSAIAADEGLWIPRCRAVHSLGMRVRLDVVFVDRDGRVLRIAEAVPPGRWQVGESRADAVAEFAAGFAAANALAVGTVLALEPAVPGG